MSKMNRWDAEDYHFQMEAVSNLYDAAREIVLHMEKYQSVELTSYGRNYDPGGVIADAARRFKENTARLNNLHETMKQYEQEYNAMVEQGIQVTDFGMASTPAMFMATVTEGYAFDGTVMITASHLPFNRNGFKFFTAGGGLEKGDIKEILTFAEGQETTGFAAGSLTAGAFMETYAAILADKIRSTLRGLGYELFLPGSTNQIFVTLPDAALEKLAKDFVFATWEKADDTHTTVRFCTSWATTQENADALCVALTKVLG